MTWSEFLAAITALVRDMGFSTPVVPIGPDWVTGIDDEDLVGFIDTLAWPVVALCAILGLRSALRSSSAAKLVGAIAGRVSSVRVGGFELTLDPAAVLQTKVDLEREFGQYREALRGAFDRSSEQWKVPELQARIAEEVLKPKRAPALASSPTLGFRCTVYVRDLLFRDALYRATDYYPEGGTSGAVYSARFGIIGRQWRLSKSHYEPNVPSDPVRLMTDWGMTRAEASRTMRAQSFIVVILRHREVDCGLLFVEADPPDAFAGDVLEALENSTLVGQLAERLADMDGDLRDLGPRLDLFR